MNFSDKYNLKFILAIENNELNEATTLQRSLAVDYGSLSAHWSTALRSLIVAKQQIIEPTIFEPTLVTDSTSSDYAPDEEGKQNLLVDTSQLSEDVLTDSGTQHVKGRVIHV